MFQRISEPPSPTIALSSSPLEPKPFQTSEPEVTEPPLPLQARLQRADRLGFEFDKLQILSPQPSEPRLTPQIQLSAAAGALIGGGLVGTTSSTGAAGLTATGTGAASGMVLVGVIAVGGTLVLGVYALGAMTSVPTGDPETWPRPNPQPGPPPQAPGQRVKLAPLPPEQDPSALPTYTPEQLGMTRAEVMEFVSQESVPGRSPTGIREDLIPMTGDLPGELAGILMEPPEPQVLGEDPVQIPGVHEPLTTPLQGPRSPQVEVFPGGELNQPGEIGGEAESPSEREASGLQKAMQAANWDQVKDLIGKTLEEVGEVPGYSSRPKHNPEELVRQIQDDKKQVPLQLDENGQIQIKVGGSNRLSNPYRMKKNFTQTYGEIEEGFWSHHLIPDEVVQRARLTRFAHEQGWYDLDRETNQLGMPDRETFKAIQSGEKQPVNRQGHTSSVGHWSNHTGYSRRVEEDLIARERRILSHFGVETLDDVPREHLGELKEFVLEQIGKAEDRFRDLIHRRKVDTKDGRLSWEQVDEVAT